LFYLVALANRIGGTKRSIAHVEQLASYEFVKHVKSKMSKTKKTAEQEAKWKPPKMSPGQLSTLSRGLSDFLDRHQTPVDVSLLTTKVARMYQAYLFTLTLTKMPPPRTQVFRALKIGESFRWNPNQLHFEVSVFSPIDYTRSNE
jgi:hypothetical protein